MTSIKWMLIATVECHWYYMPLGILKRLIRAPQEVKRRGKSKTWEWSSPDGLSLGFSETLRCSVTIHVRQVGISGAGPRHSIFFHSQDDAVCRWFRSAWNQQLVKRGKGSQELWECSQWYPFEIKAADINSETHLLIRVNYNRNLWN